MSFIRVNEEIFPLNDIGEIREAPRADGDGVEIVLRSGKALVLRDRTIDEVWASLERAGVTTIYLHSEAAHHVLPSDEP